MKPQYQTRYELLHESYQKWLTGFTRHAVSWGVCHPNIYYFHNLTPGWWICPYISRHLLSLNPLQARCRRYSRGER